MLMISADLNVTRIIVTGSARGLGMATVRKFAEIASVPTADLEGDRSGIVLADACPRGI
jgi:NAD(P)-dependent dehydrogenase (short-subunit alcohol dehydrogenase family)